MERGGSRIVLGTMDTGGNFDGLILHKRDRADAGRFIQRAVDCGFTTFDTAPIYARGTAEAYLGEFLPKNIEVWTKVGVDIDQVLPKLDYTFDGMRRSIEGSCKRLRRTRFDRVWIHNPLRGVLMQDAVYQFSDWVQSTELAKSVGISLLNIEDVSAIREPNLFPWLMCERTGLDKSKVHALKAQGFALCVRSILNGGRLLDERSTSEERNLFASIEVDRLIGEFRPSAIVVGPRTAKQLEAYVG